MKCVANTLINGDVALTRNFIYLVHKILLVVNQQTLI